MAARQVTQQQLDAANAEQQREDRHPLTCGGNRGDEAHVAYAEQTDARDWGVLVATVDGWKCPVCDYRQPFGHGVI